MTPAHDARLVPAALGAWLGCVLAVVGVVPALALASAAGAAGVVGTVGLVAEWVSYLAPERAARAGRGPAAASAPRPRHPHSSCVPSSAVCAAALLAAIAVLVGYATAASVTHTQRARVPAAAVEAGDVSLRGVVDASPRIIVVRSREVAIVELALTAWRAGADRGWRTADGLVAVAVEPGLVHRDDAIEVRGDLQPGDDAPIAWDARVVSATAAPGPLREARRWVTAAAATLPEDRAGLVQGMLTGDTSAMPPEQVAHMRTSGLAHLTAVSGAHFAVVTMLVLAATRALHWPRGAVAAAVAASAALFTAFVGLAPSVARAAVMAAVVAASLALGRKARGLPALAVAVIVVVLAAPQLSLEIGLLMSVVAVAAIVVWAPVVARVFARRIAPRAARALSVPVVAQAALTPLLLVLQPGLSLWAVPANLLVVPFLVPFMTFGLAAAAVGPLVPALGEALLAVAGHAAGPVSAVAAAVAALPGARLGWHTGALGIAVAIAAVATGVGATVARPRTVRRFCAALTAVLVAAATLPSLLPVAVVDDWDIVMCDVGQGDMTLMRSGPSSAIVVDTGPDDAAATECMSRYGVTDIDLLIVSHPHADHDGAVAAVAAAARVRQAWMSAPGLGGRAATALTSARVDVGVPAAGAVVEAGRVRVEVLSDGHLDADATNLNDASLVVLARSDIASLLALGDLEPGAQRRLAGAIAPLSIDVLKVAHHGSAAQDPGLAARLSATIGIIGAGSENDYGHPSRAAIELYESRVTTLAATATCGDIIVAVPADGDAAVRCRTGVAP